MNKKDTVKELVEFFKENDTPELEGTAYHELGNGLWLVLTRVNDGYNHGVAKIAYNCDDLQCDYDFDWTMPCFLDGTVIDTESTVMHCHLAQDAGWFYDIYKALVKALKDGSLKDWRK